MRVHGAGPTAPEGVVREIMQRQAARRMIEGAVPRMGTAYETAALLLATLDDAMQEERLKPMEALLLRGLLERLVAQAHAEGAEAVLADLEASLKGRSGGGKAGAI